MYIDSSDTDPGARDPDPDAFTPTALLSEIGLAGHEIRHMLADADDRRCGQAPWLE